MNLKKTSIFLILIRFLKIFFSILTLTLIAKYFGVSVEMDIWVIASTLIAAINLTLWGPLNETFRAKFVFLREKQGEVLTMYKVRSLLVFIFFVTFIVSIILAFSSEKIIAIVAPGIVSEEKKFFLMIFLFMIPSLIINEFINIGTSILNAYDVFYLPEVLGIISAVLNLVSIFILAPHFGIFSLIIGTYLSAFIFFITIIFFLQKNEINVFSGGYSIKWKFIKPFIYFSLPFFVPYLITQIQTIIEKFLANSLGEGIVSIVNYSSQFKNITQAVLTSVLVSIMVPTLSMRFAKKDRIGFSNIFKQNIEIIFLFLTLIIPFLIGATDPIVNILFGNSDIDTNSIKKIIYLTRLYVLSILSIMIYLIFGLALLAQQQGRTYAIQGSFAQIIVIVINIIFYKKLGPTVFPISLLISHFLASLFMLKNLDIKTKKILIIKDLARYILMILILSFLLIKSHEVIELSTKNDFIQSFLLFSILVFLFLLLSPLVGFKSLSYLLKKSDF